MEYSHSTLQRPYYQSEKMKKDLKSLLKIQMHLK